MSSNDLTSRWSISANNPIPELMMQQISRAAASLRSGGVVAFPTETVYGLGADISHNQAIQKIFEIKGRPSDHPLIVHFADIAELGYWTEKIPAAAWLLARHFWPGPLTLILPKSKHIPLSVTGGQDMVGLRIPCHPVALTLLRQLGSRRALAAPSANRFGRISPTSAAHVRNEFGHEINMILEGGPCEVGLESTIVSCVDETVTILRPGGIPVTAIENLLQQVVSIKSHHSSIRTPGSLASHYAPATPLEVWPGGESFWSRFTVLQHQGICTAIVTRSLSDYSTRGIDENLHHILMPDDPVRYGKELYAMLRKLDEGKFDRILIEAPPDNPEWFAIADRLQRASLYFPEKPTT